MTFQSRLYVQKTLPLRRIAAGEDDPLALLTEDGEPLLTEDSESISEES